MINDCDIKQRRYPFRQRENIPAKFTRSVCLCREPGNLTNTAKYGGASVCSRCYKIMVYWLFKCASCDEIFFHDFVLNFCYRHPLCWNCNGEINQVCVRHTYCVTYIKTKKPPCIELQEPLSQDFIDNILTFKLPF